MTSTLLKDLAKRGAGHESEIKTGASKPMFEDNTSYLVEITDVQVKETKNGFKQLEVAMSKVTENGELKKAGRVWLNLPVYTTAQENNYDPTTFATMKKISSEGLLNFLRAAMPAVFGPTAGNAKQIAQGVAGFAIAAAEGEIIEGIVGSRVFYVLVRGTKNPEKTYHGFYSEEPSKYPLASI